MTENEGGKKRASLENVERAIAISCQKRFGVLDSQFLCEPLSKLNPKAPLCCREDTSLREVVALLAKNKVGCLLVVNGSGKLIGICSERDIILKVISKGLDLDRTSVAGVMTPNPVAEGPTATVAFALNLMSHGGFRHLPIIDQEEVPVGILSIKDIVDGLVELMANDLLEFESA